MSKRKGNVKWKELKKEYWGQNVMVDTLEWGGIDFSPQSMNEVFGGEKLSYEDYFDAQMATGRDIRGGFLCHHEVPLGFAGQIERITQKNICFKRIYVSRPSAPVRSRKRGTGHSRFMVKSTTRF